MNTIPEISIALNRLWSESAAMLKPIGEEVANEKGKAGKWTISEELEHAILSAKPIRNVLQAGPEKFLNHGLEDRVGLTYEALELKYRLALGAPNIIAPARYSKDPTNPTTFAEQQQTWVEIGQKITVALSTWAESDLDLVQLKHPLLGPLTLREMLFFTHMHTAHHFKSIGHKAFTTSQLS